MDPDRSNILMLEAICNSIQADSRIPLSAKDAMATMLATVAVGYMQCLELKGVNTEELLAGPKSTSLDLN